jgi:ribonuclease Z
MNMPRTLAGLVPRFTLACLLFLAPQLARASDFTVTLLGTGTPVPSSTRFSASILVEAGPKKFVFDMGRGAAIRLTQLQIPIRDISAYFLTHFHSDHLVGLPDLWLTGWLPPLAYGHRTTPFVLYGPAGTRALTDGLTKAFAQDIAIRSADEHDPASGIEFQVHEIDPGVVYRDSGVTITAFTNNHGALVKPSYGYKIDYQGHTVVLSGDTIPDAAVTAQAKGADLFVHSVTIIPEAMIAQNPAMKAVYDHLASPEGAASDFAAANPKLAVYSHLGLNGGATIGDLVTRTAAVYHGPLVVGEDLMAFDVGGPAILIYSRAPATP